MYIFLSFTKYRYGLFRHNNNYIFFFTHIDLYESYAIKTKPFSKKHYQKKFFVNKICRGTRKQSHFKRDTIHKQCHRYPYCVTFSNFSSSLIFPTIRLVNIHETDKKTMLAINGITKLVRRPANVSYHDEIIVIG